MGGQFLQCLLARIEHLGNHWARRHRIQPGLWTPQLRSQEGFGAVMEDLLDLDHEGEDGSVTLDDHVVEERSIGNEPRPAIDAQRVATTRNQKDQADMRVGQHVLVSVGAALYPSARRFPGRSASAMVVSSITYASCPGGSPFGDTSHAPFSSAVATRQNGDAASHWRSSSCSVGLTLLATRGIGTPTTATSSSMVVISFSTMPLSLRGIVL